jgi:hypothetical protein
MPKKQRTSLKIIGSKAQVFHGNATHTSGGLKKSDLVKNKHGRIVSRKKQAAGLKSLQYLIKAGYEPVKGKFGHSGKKGGKAAEPVEAMAEDAEVKTEKEPEVIVVDPVVADPVVVVQCPQ